jgi:hypothetical protein
VRDGYVGAPATPGIIDPNVEKERERNKKIWDDCVGKERREKEENLV